MLQSDLKPREELLVATTQFKKLACSGANCSQLTIVMMKQAAIWSTNIWYWTEAPQCYEPLAITSKMAMKEKVQSMVDGASTTVIIICKKKDTNV